MNLFELSSSGIIDKELSRMNRVDDFNAEAWLRSNKLGDEYSAEPESSTIARFRARENFVFEPPNLSAPKVEKFISEQEYIGSVLSVDSDQNIFWVRLTDRTCGLPDEEAEFPFKEIPTDDWAFIVPGALFSWNIGCEWRDGQMRRVADFRFRRFFQFSKTAVAHATERAEALSSLIAELDAYPTIYSITESAEIQSVHITELNAYPTSHSTKV